MENFTLGQAIRMLRKRKGFSARQLSASVGFSPSYCNKIENSEIEPSLKAFAKIASVLQLSNVEVIYLLNMIAQDDNDFIC